MEYTVKRDRDDMVRILKEVCGSARYLLQNVMANKLRAPYVLGRGRVIRLDCFQKKSNAFLIRNIKIFQQHFGICINYIRFIHLYTEQISKILDIRSGRFVVTNVVHGR